MHAPADSLWELFLAPTAWIWLMFNLTGDQWHTNEQNSETHCVHQKAMVILHDNISFGLGENRETQVIAGLLENDLGG